MQKHLDDMTLKDLMDRLDEMKFERLRREEIRHKQQRAAHHVLSVSDLAEYFGTNTSDIKSSTGRSSTMPVYFREMDIRA